MLAENAAGSGWRWFQRTRWDLCGIGLWALMCSLRALLYWRIYQHVPADDTGLGSLAKRYLGRYGRWLYGDLEGMIILT